MGSRLINPVDEKAMGFVELRSFSEETVDGFRSFDAIAIIFPLASVPRVDVNFLAEA